MGQENPSPQNEPPVQNQPQAPGQPVAPVVVQKSSNPWPWIVGGCLMIVILTLAVVALLGWWGIREAKKEINSRIDKYEPTMEGVKENIDRFNEEGEEWQKMSEEMRNSMPDPEELSGELDSNLQTGSGTKKK